MTEKHPHWTHKSGLLGLNEGSLLKVAEEFGESASPGDIYFLEGELGAGKSTFSRGFLQGFAKKCKIAAPHFSGSPTFSISHTYQLGGGGIHHVDCYRLKSFEELETAGLMERLLEGQDLFLIEWGSMFERDFENTIAALEGRKIFRICFEISSPHSRNLAIEFFMRPEGGADGS